MKKKISIPLELKKFNETFEKNGFEAYLVGGAVRDMLRKKTAKDWDVATNATPAQVMKMFKKVIPTGIEHGTVTVLFEKNQIEVTTYRTDDGYSDGRHPDKVSFAPSIEEDLSRRDFTINAIAASLKDGLIVDPFEGFKDIKRKIIRTVGNPLDRFSEDGLRPIRAVRFSSQLGFSIEENTFNAIGKMLHITEKVAIERFRDELLKMLTSEKPSIGLNLMYETGIMTIFLPELASCKGIEQRGFHEFDVFDHILYSCDEVSCDNKIVRLAALFHDIGKPVVRKSESQTDENGLSCSVFTFYNHENVSASMTEKIMTRLHFSRSEIQEVAHLVKNHMFHYESCWSDAAVRRFLVRIKIEGGCKCYKDSKIICNLFDLRFADVNGMTKKKRKTDFVNVFEFADRIDKVLKEENAFGIKDLKVNGEDLKKLGVEPGKQMGLILNELFETVLDDPLCNEKEKLLVIAKNFYERISRNSSQESSF